ncbi:recombinase family protein [Teichococcus vastitatis]|uniref:Recombinase family protein n=1 Tax=Teichococcus vastitatis TaxID=2307076 RepID=A0ABS9WBJ4_9PROT|nr:recombinase family protein [Pseudoroseomonas vastitatis]
MKVGYARVSTQGQDAGFEEQIKLLGEYGCKRIYSEKVSSVAVRDVFNECMEALSDGDVLVVTKLDRLARSVRDLHKIIDRLTAKGVGLVIMNMGGTAVDTRTGFGKFVLNIMGAVAELERDMILERQIAGIAKAQAEGKYKGRAPTARNQLDRIRELKEGGMSVVGIAAELGINRATVHRLMRAS